MTKRLEFLEDDSAFSDDNCSFYYSKNESCAPVNSNLLDCGLKNRSKRSNRDCDLKHFFQPQRNRGTCNEYNDDIELLINSDEKTKIFFHPINSTSKLMFSNKLKKSFNSADESTSSVHQKDMINSFETQLSLDDSEHEAEDNKSYHDELGDEDSFYNNNLHKKKRFCLWNYQKFSSIRHKNQKNYSNSKIDKLTNHENEDERKRLKQKLRKSFYKKKVKRFAKKTGSKTWKGIRTGWKYLCAGLRSLSGPLMTFNVMTDLDTAAKLWKPRLESRI